MNRFGKISPFWQNPQSVWQKFEGIFSVWQNFEIAIGWLIFIAVNERILKMIESSGHAALDT